MKIQRSLRKVFSSLRVSIVVLVFCLALFGWNTIAAADATGTLVMVDGINLDLEAAIIADMPLFDSTVVFPAPSSYLYKAINNNTDQRDAIFYSIGAIKNFPWPNDAIACTDLSVEGLASFLRTISDYNKITGSPLVIIAHSWGTVLAYIALKKNPDIVVDKLVTLGSPLNASSNPNLSPLDFALNKFVWELTYPVLVVNGIWLAEPLANIRDWHNYWTECDPVSGSIPSIENFNTYSTGEDPITCHLSYFNDTDTWDNIISDVCNTPHPLAISYSPSSTSAPVTITFNAIGTLTSDPAASYTWNFGDGQTGTGITTSHFYRNSGNYNVSVTLVDGAGVSTTSSELLIVAPPPINVGRPDGCEAKHVQFSTTDYGSLVTEYTWDYGDGTPTETGRSNGHTYANEGSYNVSVTLTLSDSSSISNTQPVYVGSGTQYI